MGSHKDTQQKRAIKVIARSKIKNWDRFLTEVKILQQLDHPNVIKLYEYFEEKENVYLVTELCAGGELFDRIIEKEFFTEVEAAKVFKQILQALNYCHSNNIVHRDLKPENFLYAGKSDDSDIKIIDYLDLFSSSHIPHCNIPKSVLTNMQSYMVHPKQKALKCSNFFFINVQLLH